MRILVTGRGSIAKRHVRHLRALAPDAVIGVVASQTPDEGLQPCEWLPDWEAGLAWKPDGVVVASISSRHANELIACLQRGWPCLAEKPLVCTRQELEAVRAARAAGGRGLPVVVGCNLRYLLSLQQVKAMLDDGSIGRIVRAAFEVGQDLSQWRPGRSLAESYSARAEQGGGVLFDLVHEVDMARHLLGPMEVKAALGAHLGPLPLTVDDVHVALLRLPSGAPVTISLDYVSQKLVRRYTFVGDKGTLYWDLVGKRAWIDKADGPIEVAAEPAEFDMGETYRAQMHDWLHAMADSAHVARSPLEDALETTELMLTMKEAAA